MNVLMTFEWHESQCLASYFLPVILCMVTSFLYFIDIAISLNVSTICLMTFAENAF